MKFVLTKQQHADFYAAVGKDDPVELRRVIKLAIGANNWTDEAWWDIRDANLRHYIWVVAHSGKARCFRYLVDFVYGECDWSELPTSCQDGLLARFPNDIQHYISRCMPVLALSNNGCLALEIELAHLFEVFLQRKIDLFLEMTSKANDVTNMMQQYSTELTKLIQSGMSVAVEDAKSKISGKYDSRLEADELGMSIENAASKAVAKLRV